MTTSNTATSKLDTLDPTLPPVARRLPTTATHHGIAITDDYAWLRAANWQEVMRDPSLLDAEIRAYLEAENAYTEAALADTKLCRRRCFGDEGAASRRTTASARAHGPYEYFPRYVQRRAISRSCAVCRAAARPMKRRSCSTATPKPRAKPYWDLGSTAH